MTELLAALSTVSPLIATIVVITLLVVIVVERVFGMNGPWSRVTTWLGNRELERQRRADQLEEQRRLSNDARVAHLLDENAYVMGELQRATGEARKAAAELHAAREELDQVRDELRIVHHLLDATTRAGTRHAAWDDTWAPLAREAGIPVPDPPPTLHVIPEEEP